ncbi:isovaleryl-CoA dehydrogenase [Acinetobacter larvae]|uniref:DNA alkylation response protein n=1 Tax=Acinetobacter larvae TaxID=1789224 RepID=A0A1B2M086_9GAMM|nr:isovaleryl-CoA dehydrogenase [Acinetobacter larvae]AOA58606.1 DNA alkylation response protein [Acinetobacter larvae]
MHDSEHNNLRQQFQTHRIENQPTALFDQNLWQSDLALQQATHHYAGDWADQQLNQMGAVTGIQQMTLGELANTHKPILHRFDRYGRRIDEVEFHPAYHQLMHNAAEHAVHNFSWQNQHQSGAHVIRSALMYINSQADAGTACPLTMTHAAVPCLAHSPELSAIWLPKILANGYDPRALPIAEKQSCTIGMGMTEKQGGSDVRRNSSRAYLQANGDYQIVGHKFFFSAPMCDAHLVLAQLDAGLSCFLMPRILPDGSLNAVHVQRLKNKLGDWSNASSEVEFQGATAYLIGEAGRGIATILEMVALTRLDCVIGSAAQMRQALVQVLDHVKQRAAFGKLLIDQPIMRNVLTDLSIESEAALLLGFRVAQAIDAAPHDATQAAFARIATAIAKFWVCKRTPAFINEAQECLGGIGYVEENILPRLYRQAPLNSIWEGSGNIQCLDVLRSLHKDRSTAAALFAELKLAQGRHPAYDQHLICLEQQFQMQDNFEKKARLLVERTALALQAAQLLLHGDPAMATMFCATRFGTDYGFSFGSFSDDQYNAHILTRAMPNL